MSLTNFWTGTAAVAVVFVVVLVVLFVVLRVFWLWYWRVNAIHDRLEEIRDGLERLNATAAAASAASLTQPVREQVTSIR